MDAPHTGDTTRDTARQRVLVTRPARDAARWVDELRALGFHAHALPLIEIAPPTDLHALDSTLDSLAAYKAVMFVSSNAVHGFFERLAGRQWPAGTRAWATGGGTQRALLAAGVPATAIDSPPADAAQFDSETLWPAVCGQVRAGDRVLIVRGDEADGAGRDWLAAQVEGAGGAAQFVAAYRRELPRWGDAERATAGDATWVWLFSSSQAIANLQKLMPAHDWSHARALATHPRIARAARDAGFGVVCESRPVMDSVAAALESIG